MSSKNNQNPLQILQNLILIFWGQFSNFFLPPQEKITKLSRKRNLRRKIRDQKIANSADVNTTQFRFSTVIRKIIRTIKKRSPYLLLAICTMLMVFSVYLSVDTPKALAATAAINKSFLPTLVNPGQSSTLTVVIFNSNVGVSLTNAAFTDNLPVGMKVATPANIVTSCGATVTAPSGATSFSVASATVPAKVGSTDGQCSFSVDIFTIVSGNSVNNIPINSLTNTQNITNDTPASATLQVNSIVAPSISKILSPNTIFAGDNSTLTVTINNNDPNVNLTNVGITDGLPTNVTISGGATTTCLSGSVSTTTGSVILSGATINKSSSCTVTVPITSTVTGSYTNSIPAGSLASQQGATNSSLASAPLTVQIRRVNISKTLSSPQFVNDPSTLIITLTNPTLSTAYTGTSVTDTFPLGLVVANPPIASTTCTSGAVTATAGNNSVALSGGNIPANSSCTVTVSVTSTTAATYNNNIPIGAVGTAQGATNTTAAPRSVVFNTRTVNVAKSFIPASQSVNGTSTLTITLTNPTTTTAYTGTSVTDTFPSGLVVANPPTASTTCTSGAVAATAGNNSVGLSGGSIPANSSCTVKVSVTSATTGTYNNNIPIDAVTTNEGIKNTIAASSSITFTNLDITGSKSYSTNPVNRNVATTLTITLNNSTTTPLTGLNVTDTLPTGLNVAATPALGGTCIGTGSLTSTASSITLTGGNIAANSSCTITVNVTSPLGGTYVNTIAPNSISTDQGASNSGAINDTTSLTVRSITVAKTFSPTSTSLNGTSTLTIALRNFSGVSLTGLTATDNLPANLVVDNPPVASTSNCGGGTVTNLSGGVLVGGETAFKLSAGAGSLATAGNAATSTCTVTINVTPTTTGNKNNTINGATDVSNTQGINATSGSATLAVTAGDITVAKSFLPLTVNVGSPSTLSVTITNPSNSGSITALSLTDTLPTGLLIANPPNRSITCTNSIAVGTVTATAGTNTVTLSGQNFPASNGNRSCTFNVNVVATSFGSGTYTNTIPANAITNTDGRTNANPATAPLNVIGASLSKAFFPTTIAPNGRSVLTVTVTNFTSTPLTNAGVIDNLPQAPVAQAIKIASAPNNASTTCASGSVSTTATSFTLSGATVPAAVSGVSGVCTFQVEVTGTASSSSNTNTLPVGRLTNTQGISNQSAATAILNFSTLSISVNKSFLPLTVSGGSTSVLSVTVTNPTLIDYIGVKFTDTLPTNMQVAPNANATTDCVNGTVTAISGSGAFSLGGSSFGGAQVAANSTCTVSISVVSLVTGNLTNTIPIGGVTSFQGASNTQVAQATLTNLPGVGIAKVFSPNIIDPNQISRLTITIFNVNNNTLTNTAFTDNLPLGVTVATIPNTATTCTNGTVSSTSTSVSLSGATITPNTSCTISADVTASVIGTYVNTIPQGAVTNTEGSSNPQAVADSLKIFFSPTVSKSFNPSTIAVNGTSTLTITLANTNSTSITLTSLFTDTLPTGLTVANPPNVSGTCTLANVTATPATNTVTYSSGSTIPVGSCTIKVDVTGSGSGDFTNTIPSGALQTSAGNNANPASAVLTIGSPAVPSINLVKRITNINGTDISGFVTGLATATSNDGDLNWPSANAQYLRGAIACPTTGVCAAPKPSDSVEYTIYFLSNGASPAKNVQFCDRIPLNTIFRPNTYGTGAGILLGWDSTGATLPDPANSTLGSGKAAITNVPDTDLGQFLAANVSLTGAPSPCDNGATNPNGAILIQLGANTSLPNATASGTPKNSYGFVRFVVNVN